MSSSTQAMIPGVRARRWHTTTFRWLSAYAAVFVVTVVLLVGVIACMATAVMERTTDDVLAWQLIYFDSIPDAELPATIRQRLEHERMHTNFYGLYSADGTLVAGDVSRFPSSLPVDTIGVTLRHTLHLIDGQQSPIVRGMAERRPDGMVLLVARDLTHIIAIRDSIIRALVIGGVLCLAAGVIGGLLLSVKQLRRVRDMRRVIQQIARGDLQQRLPVGGRDELDMLSNLVNHMLDEVERLMHEVKDACDGIAHDLRTPLAHVRALLAQIAEHSSRSGNTAMDDMVDRARIETDVLLNRFRAMLRISEIGALQRRGGFAELDLATLVGEISELYEPLAESVGVRWLTQIDAVTPIYGDRALLFEAVSNLVDNAIKFVAHGTERSEAGGQVRIVVTQTPNGPQLDIIDNGPGIALKERQAVLQPFYRSEQTMHIAGSGLGLGIVAAVLRLHDFTLRIGNAEPGARITVECWSSTLA